MNRASRDGISEAARAEGRKRLAEGLRAGIYTRMSMARMDDKTKVEDQERICRNLAEQRDWDVAGVYTDNNKSAWHRNRKRHGWDAMLADVEAGKIDAIIVYHGDRLIRQPWDLEKLILLADTKGIRLASPTGTRNLDNPDDRFILRIEAAHDCRSSDDTSRRQKARFDRWHREGRVFSGGAGGRRFGFATDGITLQPADRCDVATRREVTEADVIREMADRVLAGETTNAVARNLEARGIRSVAGKRFDGQDVRRMLMLPRYAGLMPDGENEAAWGPVLDRPTWERVRLVLETRGDTARKNAGRETRHLMSGIAVCGLCETPMQIAYISSRGYRYRLYACGRRAGCGKLYRNAEHLDAYVSRMTVNRLNDPRNPQPQVPEGDAATEWAALTKERAATEAAAKDYRTSPGRLDILMARLDSIDARMAELREREAGQSRSRLLDAYRGISAEAFAGLPLAVRRSLVSACFRVTVLPASKRGPGFNTEDVRLEPLG